MVTVSFLIENTRLHEKLTRFSGNCTARKLFCLVRKVTAQASPITCNETACQWATTSPKLAGKSHHVWGANMSQIWPSTILGISYSIIVNNNNSWHLVTVYYVPGSLLHVYTHLILTTILWGRYYYNHPQLREDETEAQRDYSKVTQLVSLRTRIQTHIHQIPKPTSFGNRRLLPSASWMSVATGPEVQLNGTLEPLELQHSRISMLQKQTPTLFPDQTSTHSSLTVPSETRSLLGAGPRLFPAYNTPNSAIIHPCN